MFETNDFIFVRVVGFEPTYREDQYDYLLKRICFTDKHRYTPKYKLNQLLNISSYPKLLLSVLLSHVNYRRLATFRGGFEPRIQETS